MRHLIALMLILPGLLAAAEPLRIVALGGSITGYRPRQPYLHQYSKFSDLVQLALEVRYGQGSVVVLNRGWAGDSTRGKPNGDPPGALNRLQQDVLDEQAAICLLMIGSNNFASKVEEPARLAARKAFREDLTAMVTRMQQAGIKVLLLRYHEERRKADVAAGKPLVRDADYNPIISEVGAALQVPVADPEPAFAAAIAAGTPSEALVNAEDGVHLNPLGEILIARVVALKLVELGWAAPRP
jgi:lysophospholipase L1-like esterase